MPDDKATKNEEEQMKEYGIFALTSAGGLFVGTFFIKFLYIVHGFYKIIEDKTRKHGKFISSTIDVILRVTIMMASGYCIFIAPAAVIGTDSIFGYKPIDIYVWSCGVGLLLNLLYRKYREGMANKR